MLTRLPTDYVATNGLHYALFEDASTGQVYTYDPNHELGSKVYVNPYTGARTLSGLGISAESAGIQAAATAANFIPGVGPIVSSVISLVGGLFGGGDPTPLSQLIDQIVNLRDQIAQAHKAMGVPDSFTIPAGFNATDKQKWASLVEGIVEQATGKSASDVQSSNRRKDYYAAISAMKNVLQDLQTQGQIQEAVSTALANHTPTTSVLQPPVSQIETPVQSVQQLAPSPVDLPSDVGFTQYPEILPPLTVTGNDYPQQTFSPTTQLIPSVQGAVAPSTDYTPWLLGGGLAILAVIVLMNRK